MGFRLLLPRVLTLLQSGRSSCKTPNLPFPFPLPDLRTGYCLHVKCLLTIFLTVFYLHIIVKLTFYRKTFFKLLPPNPFSPFCVIYRIPYVPAITLSPFIVKSNAYKFYGFPHWTITFLGLKAGCYLSICH